jgi:hypothetical protein
VIKLQYPIKTMMEKLPFSGLAQRTGGWCEPMQAKMASGS